MDEEIIDKIRKQTQDITQALARLKEALPLPPIPIHKDGIIQRFEFTFELSWKLMQTIAAYEVIEAFGPNQSIRVAAQLGYIDNPQAWMACLKSRNYATHLYNESIADRVYEKAKTLPALVEALLVSVEKRVRSAKPTA